MKIYEFIEKLRSLSENQKKAIIIVIICVLSFIFGFWWVRTSMKRLDKMGQNLKNVKVPELNISNENK